MVTINNGVEDAVFYKQKTQKFSYDFAVDGGGIGNITLRGGTIPSGAVVSGALAVCTTAITAGLNGTIKLTLQSDADLSTQYNTADVSATGTVGGPIGGGQFYPPVGYLLSFGLGVPGITTTAARSVVLGVGTAALTAGKFDLYITYMVP